ncbi:T9SS type A sorting domain-containing protein [Spirosoma sp. SC4-14]|uniref:T9SS type A sorting domain-containing protein n=1 Tax=Spirosoma sp. SC4-14 TaxID=3128900 RepID=UPI0030CE35F2
MRYLLSIFICMLAITSFAQEVDKQRYIKINYEPNQVYVEKAIEKIEAVSIVSPKSNVEYRAGRSVELLPGFQAKAGAVFVAHIRTESTTDLQLTAYPNPFDRSTTIDFVLPESGKINLYVIDAKGQVIERLLESSQQEAGRHTLEWKAENQSSGIYMPVLTTERKQISSRVIKK